MKVYSAQIVGSDGHAYFVRYLLTPEHLAGLQAAGIVGEVDEVVGLQDCADQIVGGLEKQMHAAMGGLTQ